PLLRYLAANDDTTRELDFELFLDLTLGPHDLGRGDQIWLILQWVGQDAEPVTGRNVCPKSTVCVGANSGWWNRDDRAGKRLAGIRGYDTAFNRPRRLECERDFGSTLAILRRDPERLRR